MCHKRSSSEVRGCLTNFAELSQNMNKSGKRRPGLRYTAGRSKEQKSALARDIAEALMRRCGVDASNVNVLFEDVELDH